MLVLVVNAYDMDQASGQTQYKYFLESIKKIFQSFGHDDNYYWERKYNELEDLVVDWEHEHLHHQAQQNCERFDRVDYIIISGDMSVLPWEPRAIQLVSLIHMAKFVKKPVLGLGFGAFASVYALAVRGTRFYILNGPKGNELQELATFPHYSIGTGAFPSAWLDHVTGDLYSYSAETKEWKPITNIGIHYVASTGKPTTVLPHAEHDHNADQIAELHALLNASTVGTIAPSSALDTVGYHEDLLVIHSRFLTHSLVKSLPANKRFPVKLYADWYINDQLSLPTEVGLLAIGQGKRGPILLSRDQMMLSTVRFDRYHSAMSSIFDMIKAFITSTQQEFMKYPNGVSYASLSDFLFAQYGTIQGHFDTNTHRLPYTSSLSKQPVKSTLTTGPIKVDPPVMEMFYSHRKTKAIFDVTVMTKAEEGGVDIYALTQKRRNSTVGKRPKQTVQNPCNQRIRRIVKMIQHLGQSEQRIFTPSNNTPSSSRPNSRTNRYPRKESITTMLTHLYANPNEDPNKEEMPEDVKNMLAGKEMNSNSISRRIRGQYMTSSVSNPLEMKYRSIYPKKAHFTKLQTVYIGSSASFDGEVKKEPGLINEHILQTQDPLLSRPKDDEELEDEDGVLRIQTRRPFAFYDVQDEEEDGKKGEGEEGEGEEEEEDEYLTPEEIEAKYQAEMNSLINDDDDDMDLDLAAVMLATQQHRERTSWTRGTSASTSPSNTPMPSLPPPSSRDLANPFRKKPLVPIIEDWIKVYEQPSVITNNAILGSQSARTASISVKSTTSSPKEPARPMTIRPTSLSARTKQLKSTTVVPSSANISPRSLTSSTTTTPTPMIPQDPQTSIAKEVLLTCKTNYLPIKHPQYNIPTKPSEETKQTKSGYKRPTTGPQPLHQLEASLNSYRTIPLHNIARLQGVKRNNNLEDDDDEDDDEEKEEPKGDIIVLSDQPIKHPYYNTYHTIQHKILQHQEQIDQGDYQGHYHGEYLSHHEKQIKETYEAHQKNISKEPFRATFLSEYNSALKIRQEGGIRAHSEYPKPPVGFFDHAPAIEWEGLRFEKPVNNLAGPWK